ncbi:unnamed protein product [Orchesella dallaii]|uniref:Uncharacterized protein n=1 Tax=Orchesella dallaii TaxID=48710 RepID=A0ABP1R372_9HEXA
MMTPKTKFFTWTLCTSIYLLFCVLTKVGVFIYTQSSGHITEICVSSSTSNSTKSEIELTEKVVSLSWVVNFGQILVTMPPILTLTGHVYSLDDDYVFPEEPKILATIYKHIAFLGAVTILWNGDIILSYYAFPCGSSEVILVFGAFSIAYGYFLQIVSILILQDIARLCGLVDIYKNTFGGKKLENYFENIYDLTLAFVMQQFNLFDRQFLQYYYY